MEKPVILSSEGLKKLEQELEHLKSVKRREVAERIKVAREFGDISENSEYEDAKNEQAFIEGRILTLEKMVRNAQVLDGLAMNTDVVQIGSRVRIKELNEGGTYEYHIVGSTESDPDESRISNESPVGKALLGQRAGGVVEIHVPMGMMKYEILEIIPS
ncbi:MAG: transcription elongation factor GreA [Thermaerobacter sp.]|nr:transcription elongation factor GreA [Thermaerobacter sp.]